MSFSFTSRTYQKYEISVQEDMTYMQLMRGLVSWSCWSKLLHQDSQTMGCIDTLCPAATTER